MTGRNSWLLGALSLVLSLLVIRGGVAQDAGTKPKPDVPPRPAEAVGDDFRPMFPPGKLDGHGPRGPHEFGRPGGPGKQVPGGPPGEKPAVHPGEGGRGIGPFERPGFSEGFPRSAGPPPGALGPPPGGLGPQLGPPRWPHGDWQSLQQNDPEMHKLLQADFVLERQCQTLVMEYWQAPQDQREGVKQRLEQSVTEHFEARQQRRLLELKRLEEELTRLRDSIDKRTEAQPQIVNRRVAELLGLQDEPQF